MLPVPHFYLRSEAMSIQPTTETITDDLGNPHTYEVTPFGAIDGRKLFLRVCRVAGPALGALTAFASAQGGSTQGEGAEGSSGAQKADSEGLTKAIAHVAQLLIDEDKGGLIDQLLKHTTRDGQPLSNAAVFNQVFAQNYGEMFAAVALALRVNFKGALGRVPFDPAMLKSLMQ